VAVKKEHSPSNCPQLLSRKLRKSRVNMFWRERCENFVDQIAPKEMNTTSLEIKLKATNKHLRENKHESTLKCA
jgi:hypothetical protein